MAIKVSVGCCAVESRGAMMVEDQLLHVGTWSTDSVKNVIEAAAVLGTAIYFLFRVISGFFVVNMSVSVSAMRGYKDENEDWLAATISLKKGDRRAIAVHNVCALARGADKVVVPMTLTDSFTRWTFTTTGSGAQRRTIVPDKVSTSKEVLNLSPGEELVLGSFASAPRDKPVLVEVAILAKATASPMWSQWKTSCVSLPDYPAKAHVAGDRRANAPNSAY